VKRTLTPADLLTMGRPPNGKHYELSGSGELIAAGNAGKKHELTKSRTASALFKWERPEVGVVFSETMFSVGEGARIPDVAFVSKARMDAHPEDDGPISFAPNLAIEVVSDSEPAEDAELKVREYLAAGVEEVWQMYPKGRFVRVRTSDGYRDLYPSDAISTPVLPGFNTPVGDLFPA